MTPMVVIYDVMVFRNHHPVAEGKFHSWNAVEEWLEAKELLNLDHRMVVDFEIAEVAISKPFHPVITLKEEQ